MQASQKVFYHVKFKQAIKSGFKKSCLTSHGGNGKTVILNLKDRQKNDFDCSKKVIRLFSD